MTESGAATLCSSSAAGCPLDSGKNVLDCFPDVGSHKGLPLAPPATHRCLVQPPLKDQQQPAAARLEGVTGLPEVAGPGAVVQSSRPVGRALPMARVALLSWSWPSRSRRRTAAASSCTRPGAANRQPQPASSLMAPLSSPLCGRASCTPAPAEGWTRSR